MKEQKKGMSVVKKMMIALIAGLIVGIACLFLRENLIASGNENLLSLIHIYIHSPKVDDSVERNADDSKRSGEDIADSGVY